MCGRYTLTQTEKLTERFHVSAQTLDVPPNFNVAPGQQMPVITGDNAARTLDRMKWGLIPSWSKDPKIGYKLINARAETLFEKPMWRSVIRTKRCLIPASGFYEWKRESRAGKDIKQPFYIHPKDTELFAFAGVWEMWHDVEGVEWKTYSIITTEPNKEMTRVHNRMPVILHPEDEATWLASSSDNDRGVIETLLRPYEDNGLEMYEVSSDVNVTKNNDNTLIYPLNSQ
ncbi:MAG: SOS response-associated peptidase [Candidatus Saccharimonadales bacterium]